MKTAMAGRRGRQQAIEESVWEGRGREKKEEGKKFACEGKREFRI